MSEIHLLMAIGQKYATMAAGERIERIKKLVAKSEANRDFIRKYYPEFYQEAFPSARAAGERKESARHPALCAEHR